MIKLFVQHVRCMDFKLNKEREGKGVREREKIKTENRIAC